MGEALTVDYHYEGGSTAVRIQLEEDDPAARLAEADVDAEPIDWIELKKDDAKDPERFTAWLERCTHRANPGGWCYGPAWDALLTMLKLRQPLPQRVAWPKESDA